MQVCHFQHLLRQFDKNEPGRFLGEGVSFRAKLIGVLEVPEARGDRMCQEALADLKMAIRAAGEHKQRIQVHVAIDGLRLRDDKTGDSLYHHPVHKISFIAQDMTDSRAFGYIFGSPDTGHRFFGIKTDKAASQVVIAMRDLFQVVFELKKKEVELAKQQLVEGMAISSSSIIRHTASGIIEPSSKSKNIASTSETSSSTSKNVDTGAEGGVAELVDLEQELSSLRRGLTQVEGLTPSTDPFGDSFIVPPQSQKGLLPPPPSGSSTRGRNTPSSRVFSPNKQPSLATFDLATVATEFDTAPPTSQPSSFSMLDKYHADEPPVQSGASTLSYDVFTELDPLGTGRSKPYVDKKLFFQELKNPPKKVLKDLVPTTQTTSLLSEILPEPKVTTASTTDYGASTTMTSLSRHSGGTVSIAKPSYTSNNFFSSDPFAETDPFDNTDPFSDTLKDDPFTSMAEFPKSLRTEEFKNKLSRELDKVEKELSLDGKNVFNGPLQVSLPPEPVPKSPRLQRLNTDTSGISTLIRQRPQLSSKENASPPPPLPPKKIADIVIARPPPRPPHDHELDHDEGSDTGPPLPRPARKKEPMADRSTKPRISSVATNSSEEEYLTPAPPPLPAARRFDITLSQLLVLTMPELAARLRVPEATLSSMTLPQLTEYLRSYLAADNERAHIHIEPSLKRPEKDKSLSSTILPSMTLTSGTTLSSTGALPSTASLPSTNLLSKRSLQSALTDQLSTASTAPITDFKPQFEDNFAPTSTETGDSFVANFDDFDKKANPSYDRYAAFREIQEQELKSKSISDPKEGTKDEQKQDSDEKEELTAINNLMKANQEREDNKELSRSPLKTLDELTLDTFNMFRNSVSPKPSQIDAKIEDIKSVMMTLQIEKSRRSVSPRENNIENKHEDSNDRYAALREITITEPPQDEFESLPPEGPKERKRSDEKSDGFDNSDFFDCIDNSSLSFSHVEDAFRKSPGVKEREEVKVEEKKEAPLETPSVREIPPPPARLSTESISDVASGSSPDTKDKCVSNRGTTRAGRWAVLGGTGASPWSSDSRESDPRPRRRRGPPHHSPPDTRGAMVQTSSSSRDVSPWDEEPPPVTRLQRPPSHRESSRHNSSGSRECLDSGSGREKDKKRDKRDSRDRDRDTREPRDRRDSGSSRDRHRRDTRRSRERDSDTWDRERNYSRERDYRDSRSRERQKDYRDKERDRHRKTRLSYDDEEDYSDGCASGRSSPRDRWSDQRWRRDERNYGSLGWRESRRRNEIRQTEDPERRYGSTLGWPTRRASSRREIDRDRERDPRDTRDPREPRDTREPREPRDPRDPRDARDPRDPRRRSRREEPRQRSRDYRFSSDFSPRDNRDHPSPFDNDFQDTPTSTTTKKRAPYSSLEGTRFSFEPEEATASPLSVSSARRDNDSTTRFRFDSDSMSPRSMFEDDFTTISTPRCRTASIAEEDEDVPPLRTKPQQAHRDIKKSESVNIFTRDSDPFEGDEFFACTGSNRAARRENWPGDFQGFDNA